MPEVLNLDEMEEVSLTFSTRVDSMSNRGEGEAATVKLLGLVHFKITVLERVQ